MAHMVSYDLLENTYRGKRVFLTGHTGFKGSWLLLMLRNLGAEVKGYALPPENEDDLYNLINGDHLCRSVLHDIRDLNTLKKELLDFQPDFVIHMAAQALVLNSYDDPVYTMETNVIGTVNLLEACRWLDKPAAIINVTTDKVYENEERPDPYREEEPLGGYDPYSASKAASEIVTQSYRRSFFHPSDFEKHHKSVATARSGNVIGGGDWSANRIIPDLARSLSRGEKLIVRNPAAVRPWQHVLDPLSGYLTLGARMTQDPVKYAGAYNFGPEPGNDLTVEGLIKTAIETWGSGAYETPDIPEKPHEAGLLKLDITKAKKELGWQPVFDARRAIEETIAWYQYPGDRAQFTRQQTDRYFDLMK